MNTKKLLIIVLTCVVLGLISFFVYSSLVTKQTAQDNKDDTSLVSPFGDGSLSDSGNTTGQDGFVTRQNGTGRVSNTGNTDTQGETPQDPSFAPLIQLSKERVSGIGFATIQISKETEEPLAKPAADGSTTIKKTIIIPSLRIRYVERATGHIYEYNPETKETRKITNTTIPKTEESLFVDDGKRVIMRYLGDNNQTVESYLGVLPTGSVTDKLSGGFLPENILSLAPSPDTKEIFYLTRTATGSVGNILNVVDLKERRIFESPFSEWLTYWGTEGITLQTKASSLFPGYAYLLKTNGNYTKVAGGLLGLTASKISPSALVLIGSNSSTQSGILSIHNTKNKSVVNVSNLTTFPEKCAWENEGLFLLCAAPRTPELVPSLLDDWYKGKMFTADDFYFINTVSGTAEFFADINELTKTKTELDVVQMQISTMNEYAVFLDKKTGTPWLMNLSKISETLLQ